MQRLLRTIASLTIAFAFQAATAEAGETGSPSQPEAPAAAPPPAATPPATPPAAQPPAAVPATPAAPPAQPQAGSAPPQNHGTPAVVLDTQDYEGLLGKSVRAQNGDDLGRIIDVIIDREGHTRAAIIDFGGFLGVGSRKIAVDWRVLKFSTEGKTGRITLTLNRNQVRVSPEYKTGEPIVVLGAPAPAAEGEQAAAQPPAEKAAAPAQPATPEKAPEKPEKTPDK